MYYCYIKCNQSIRYYRQLLPGNILNFFSSTYPSLRLILNLYKQKARHSTAHIFCMVKDHELLVWMLDAGESELICVFSLAAKLTIVHSCVLQKSSTPKRVKQPKAVLESTKPVVPRICFTVVLFYKTLAWSGNS